MSTTATAQPAILVSDEQLEALITDDARFRLDPDRRRVIATHLHDSAPEVRAKLRELWEADGFDPEELRFVRALFGQRTEPANVVALPAPEPETAAAELPSAA